MRLQDYIGATLLGSLLCLGGCTSLRDTRLDHIIPLPKPARIDLSGHKSPQERPAQDPDLAFAVCISGGGHRASNFAIGALLALESFEVEGQARDLLREVDYLSTSSGGGLTAGLYVSSLHDHLEAGGRREDYSLAQALKADDNRLRKNLRRDYAGTVFEALLTPVSSHIDGGDFLERKLNRYVLGAEYRPDGRSLTLADVFIKDGTATPVRLPYWVANATIYETGQRFPFTPDTLRHYHVNACTHNLRQLDLAGDPGRLPLSVGMKASASFPVVFPATTLACQPPGDQLNPYLHLIDGGLSDNMGLRSAMEMLKQDPAPRKVLLLIDAYNKVLHPHSKLQRAPNRVETAYRILSIVLDRDRTQLAGNIRREAQLAEAETDTPVRTLLLGFEDLRPTISTQITDTQTHLDELKGRKRAAIKQRIQNEIDLLIRGKQAQLQQTEDAFTLYYNARNVFTSFKLLPGEQNLLFQAGRTVVENSRESLQALLE